MFLIIKEQHSVRILLIEKPQSKKSRIINISGRKDLVFYIPNNETIGIIHRLNKVVWDQK